MYQRKTVGRSIGKLSNQIRRRLEGFSCQNGVSGSQGKVLHFLLAQTDDVFQRDIEQEFSMRPSSATEMLKLMEKNGLIRRETMPDDARLKRIIVTEKAAERREQVVADLERLEEDLTRGIDGEKLDIFFAVVQQMTENLTR